MSKKWLYLKKGLIRDEWKGLDDGQNIEWAEEKGLTLFVYLNKPSDAELECFGIEMPIKLVFKDVDGVGFFAFNFGNLGWIDCAFSPSLYAELPEFNALKKNQGYPLNLMVVDTSIGELKLLRTVSLSADFTTYFRDWCVERIKNPVSKEAYENIIDETFKTFDKPEKFVNVADKTWSYSPGEDIRREYRKEIE